MPTITTKGDKAAKSLANKQGKLALTTALSSTIGLLETNHEECKALCNRLVVDLVNGIKDGFIRRIAHKSGEKLSNEIINAWLENDVAPFTGKAWKGTGPNSHTSTIRAYLRQAARPAHMLTSGSLFIGTDATGDAVNANTGAIMIDATKSQPMKKYNESGLPTVALSNAQLQALANEALAPKKADHRGTLEVSIVALEAALLTKGDKLFTIEEMYVAESLYDTLDAMIEAFKEKASDELMLNYAKYCENKGAEDAVDAAATAKAEAANGAVKSTIAEAA